MLMIFNVSFILSFFSITAIDMMNLIVGNSEVGIVNTTTIPVR